MKNRVHQKEEMETDRLSQGIAEQAKLADESRRNFTKSGLAVSGVLLTLASRSALGGGFVCKSPSGFLSGNVSQHGTPLTCDGRTPGYWGTNTDAQHPWPSPYKTGTFACVDGDKKSKDCSSQDYKNWSGGTMFNDAFLGFYCSGFGAHLASYSMMQVILLGGNGDPYQLGAHIVSALLNARMGWTPVLTEAQVRNIFNEYDLKGYFEPTAGVKWYPAEIVDYLKSTMA